MPRGGVCACNKTGTAGHSRAARRLRPSREASRTPQRTGIFFGGTIRSDPRGVQRDPQGHPTSRPAATRGERMITHGAERVNIPIYATNIGATMTPGLRGCSRRTSSTCGGRRRDGRDCRAQALFRYDRLSHVADFPVNSRIDCHVANDLWRVICRRQCERRRRTRLSNGAITERCPYARCRADRTYRATGRRPAEG